MFLWPQGMPSKLASKRLAVCTFPHRQPPFARPDPSRTFLKPILVLLSRLFWKAEAQALILPDASWAVPCSLLLRAWSLCASLPMGWCTQCYLYLSVFLINHICRATLHHWKESVTLVLEHSFALSGCQPYCCYFLPVWVFAVDHKLLVWWEVSAF